MSFPALRQDLSQRHEQRLMLQPRMLLSVEVLQLGALDLTQFLAEKALSNEALELDSALAPMAGLETGPGGNLASGANHGDEPSGPTGSRDAADAHWRMLNNHPEREVNLQSSLEEQLVMADFCAQELAWVRFLVSCLDDSGYLSLTDEALFQGASEVGLPGGMAALGKAIANLQGLEPRGIGGRSAVEALILQIDPNDPDYPILCALLEQCLDDLARNKWPKVAKRMGLEGAELKRLVLRLGELDPRPAAGLLGEAAPALHPDLRIQREEDGAFALSLNRGLWPDVRIDSNVQTIAQDASVPKEVRHHLRGKLEEARWLVDAVHQRQATLLRVAGAVFQAQNAFLIKGPCQLRALSMQAIAEELGLAVSTISRAVAGKYADTPWGILPLREFFQSKAGSTSREGLRELVRSLVDAEDAKAPLSDEALVQALSSEGHRVARRTVAKYRGELGIKSSYQRMQHS